MQLRVQTNGHLRIETSPERQGPNLQLIIRTSRMRVRADRGSDEPVAQGQYVVSDTRCPALYVCQCR